MKLWKKIILNAINFVVAHATLLWAFALEGHPLFLAAMMWGFLSSAIIMGNKN